MVFSRSSRPTSLSTRHTTWALGALVLMAAMPSVSKGIQPGGRTESRRRVAARIEAAERLYEQVNGRHGS